MAMYFERGPCLCGAEDCVACRGANAYRPCACESLTEVGFDKCDQCGEHGYQCDGCKFWFVGPDVEHIDSAHHPEGAFAGCEDCLPAVRSVAAVISMAQVA